MTDRRNHRFMLAVLLGSAASVALATGLPALAATDGIKVGTAAAARPGVTGTPPQQEKRVIEVGTNVLADERIVTTANSQAQLLFNDGSSFSVGPDCDIVIDKFVFDPATGNGEMSLSVGKGVFRFVGGKISKNSSVEVKTPTATMGIRGGIATLNVAPGQPVVGRFLFGKQMSMTQNGVTQTTVKAGTVIEALPGAPPSPPRPATPAEIRQTISQLEAAPAAAPAAPAGGGGGDSGGGQQQQAAAPAPAAPAPASIESKMESSNISQGNSGTAPTAVVVVAPSNPTPPAAPTPPAPPQIVTPPVPVVTAPTTTTTSLPSMIGRFLIGDETAFSSINDGNGDATPDSALNQGLTGFSSVTTGGITTLKTTLLNDESTIVDIGLPLQSGLTIRSLTDFLFGNAVAFGAGTDFQVFNFFDGSSLETSEFSGLIFAGTPTTAAQFRTNGLGMHTLVAGSSAVPLLHDGVNLVVAGVSASVSPLFSAYGAAQTPNAVLTSEAAAPSVALQATLGLFGQGVDQQSYLVGGAGTYVSNPATTGSAMVLGGAVRGAYRLFVDDRNTQVVSSLSSASAGANGSSIFGADGEYMVLTPDQINLSSGGDGFGGSGSGGGAQGLPPTGSLNRTTQVGRELEFGDFNNGSGYYFTEVGVRQTTSLPTVLTATARTARTLNGYAGGLMERFTGNDSLGGAFSEQDTPFINTPTEGGGAFSVSLTTSPSFNRVSATFDLAGADVEGSQVAVLNFGGTNSAFINDRLFGATESNSQAWTLDNQNSGRSGLLVSSDLVPVSAGALASGVTLCTTCNDLSWGWFVADLQTDNGEGSTQQARIHMGTFVTGTLSVSVPIAGRASFNGHMIGNVRNGGDRYIAIGNYTQLWDFSTRQGQFQVSGFDGMRINGGLTSGSDPDFFGDFGSSNTRFADAAGVPQPGFFSGQLIGSFFSGVNGAAGSVGGQYFFDRTEAGSVVYQAAGTFAAGPAVVAPLTGWQGRFIRDDEEGINAFTGFNNQTLAVTLTPGFHDPIGQGSPSGQFVNIANQYIQVPTPQGDFFLSFLSGSQPITDFNFLSPFGPNDGKLFVNPERTFFIAGGFDIVDEGSARQAATVVFGGLPTPNASFPTSGQRALQLVSGANTIPLVGDFLRAENFAEIENAVISPLYSAYSTTQTSAQATASPNRSLHLQASMLLSGQGGAQQSFLLGETGAYIAENGDDSIMVSAGMQGSARLTSSSLTTRFVSGVATADVGTSTIGVGNVGVTNAVYGLTGENMVLIPDQTEVVSGNVVRTPGAGFQQPHENLTGEDTYFVDFTTAMVQPSILTSGARTTRLVAGGTQLNGYVGGLAEVSLAGGSFPGIDGSISNANNLPTDFVIETNATTNRIGGSANMTIGGDNYNIALGSLTGSNSGHGAFINDELFAMRNNANDALSSFNGSNTATRSRVFMVSHDVVGVASSAIPEGVNLCTTCNFMSWGWWVADVRHDTGPTAGQRDRVHLATWVAGTLPSLTEVAGVTGTASYSGHAIGNVNNEGSRYVAIGNFTKTWDFGARTGAATISNFDSKNVNFTTGSSNGRDFTGTLNASGTTSGVNAAALAGSFFKGAGDPVKAAAGNFAFTAGGSYQASGTFIATKAGGP